MPKWGLTDQQIATHPWGLSEDLLAPAKTITDPVQGDIWVNKLEVLLLDSPPLQRLRRVKQLGTTHAVYPAATHSRFAHALGTLRVAQDLLDVIWDNRTGPQATQGLLDQWYAGGVLDEEFAKATVLARLGALLHDICHVPLGHTIEDDLGVLVPHDQNAQRFERLWEQIDSKPREAIQDAEGDLFGELRMLILSKELDQAGHKKWTPGSSKYPFVADIVGNTICADLMDYLERDHLFTGLPFAVGDRFMSSFYVRDAEHLHYAKRMVVRVSRSGHTRADVVTELVKYLRYRYELTERVLTHHAKIAEDAMIGKLLEMWSDVKWAEVAAERYEHIAATVGQDDVEALKKAIAKAHPEAPAVTAGAPRVDVDAPLGKRFASIGVIDSAVRDLLENEFLRRSDDGLLEYLRDLGSRDGAKRREQAIGELAQAVLDRRLYKLIGRAEGRADKALAQEKYQRFGAPDVRRELERTAARRARVSPGWKVVVWLPRPEMRLKVAEVLVDDGDGVAPLERVFDSGDQIVTQHKNLWSVSVYAHDSIRPTGEELSLRDTREADVLLGFFKDSMDLRFVRWDGQVVRSLHELAVHTVAEYKICSMNEDQRRQLLELLPAAAGGDDTFDDLLKRTWQAAAQRGWTNGVQRPPKDL